MYFIKAVLVIFLIHLCMIGFMCFMVAACYCINRDSEAHVLWLLYANIAAFPFPLLWDPVCLLIYPPDSPFANDHLNYFWDGVIAPGYIYLIVGWLNWCIILMPFVLIGRVVWRLI